jgi:RNA polymerase sigma factor (sigma-70 family)
MSEQSRLFDESRFDTAALVVRARDGDESCWDALVDRFAPLVWRVAQSFRLREPDAADVTQIVWLRLVDHLGDLRQPERLGAWLVTTTRRECLRHTRLHSREVVVEPEQTESQPDPVVAPDARVLQEEQLRSVRDVVALLPRRSRILLQVLCADPPLSYADISRLLHIPIGSIGPTRARVVASLREQLDEKGAEPGEAAPYSHASTIGARAVSM